MIDPNTGNTPLHYACISKTGIGKAQILKLLLKHGAQPDILNHSKSTALHLCALHNKVHLAEALLSGSTDVNLVNAKQETALHICCSQSATRKEHRPSECHSDEKWHIEIAMRILKHGADVNISNCYSETVLHLCFTTLRQGSRTMFSCYCPPEPHTFNCSFYDKTCATLLQALLDTGNVNPNKHRLDCSPLSLYYFKACTGDVGDERLLQLGANPNAKHYSRPAFGWWMKHLCSPEININLLTSVLERSILLNIQAGLDVNQLNIATDRYLLAGLNRLRNVLIADLMRLSGLKIFTDQNNEISNELLNSSKYDNDFWGNLRDAEFREPLSLQQAAANIVRTSLKPNAIVGIKFISLPKDLKKFLLFNYTPSKVKFPFKENATT